MKKIIEQILTQTETNQEAARADLRFQTHVMLVIVVLAMLLECAV